MDCNSTPQHLNSINHIASSRTSLLLLFFLDLTTYSTILKIILCLSLAESREAGLLDEDIRIPRLANKMDKNKEVDQSLVSINQIDSPASETDSLLVKKSQSTSDEAVSVKNSVMPRFKTVKNIASALCLWLGYFVISAAYSLFAPFFPGEVS